MRYLLVLDHTLGGTGLVQAISGRTLEDPDFQIHVIVPASADENVAATARLRTELDQLKRAGVVGTGDVVSEDPLDAVRTAAAQYHYDSAIIATPPQPLSRWLHHDLPSRVERELHIPVEWLVSLTDDPDEATSINIDLPRTISTTMPELDLTAWRGRSPLHQ